ncbi:hypothetical protein FXF51_56755 [Nonomuraea sp. PA05]|uniref:hypothetical protein n=1 Tax=Nonomuraea sp. PA05 TaxID=2604466 RepID=UPI0011D5E7C4|nr:hypothetical protein [Nonomuraea sp. PA05]TYB50233.1 hypothetical protein FXF51_56755 [Nonomuraea sp. PA05]
MALTVGELVAYAKVDRSDFKRGTKEIASDLRNLQSSTSSSMAGMEGTVVRSLADIQRAIADGLDPADAIKDLDRLEQQLDQSLRDMVDDADRFAEDLEREIDEAFAELDRRDRGHITVDVDADTTEARADIAAIQEALDALDDERVRVDVDTDPARKALSELGDVGERTGGLLGKALSDGFGVLGKVGPANVALAVAAIQALPTVAGVAAGGIVAALGGALVAVGVANAAQADRVQDAWKDAVGEIKAEFSDAAQPLEGSAIRASDVALRAFERLKPSLKRIFADVVPDVDFFIAKVGDGVGSLGPTLERLGDSFGNVLSEIGHRMPAIMDNVNGALTTFSEIADEDPQMLANVLEDATELLRVGAEVLSWADEIKLAFSIPFGPGGTSAGNNYFWEQMFGMSYDEFLTQSGSMSDALAAFRAAAQQGAAAAGDVGDESNTAAGGVKNLSAALEEFFNPAQNALAASNDWSQALQQANKELDKGNPSLLTRKMHLEELLGALAKKAETERESTGATEASSKAFEKNAEMLAALAGRSAEGGQALVGLATSLGYTVESTKKGITITDEFGKTIAKLPPNKDVKVNADTKDAQSNVGKVKNKLGELGPAGTQAGKDLGAGLSSGIRSSIGDAMAAAGQLAQAAVNQMKQSLKTHSPSRVTEEIGRWTVQGLVQGLRAEEGTAVSTVETMVSRIKEAFGSQPDVADHLLTFVSKGNNSLAALAKQREELVAKLAAAKEYAKQVAGDAAEWAAITGISAEELTSGGDLAAQLQARASAINNFANNIQTLAKRGLNKKIIQDIIDAGVEKGASYAEMLVGSDGSEIKALNKAQAAVDKASKKLGKASADAMFDSGKKAGEGYLKGLQESLKALDKEMTKIVKALVAAIKRELKIKSPSQVMAEIGQYTMEGLSVGMQSMLAKVVATAQSIVNQAVAAAKKAAGGGGGGGGSVKGETTDDFVSRAPLVVGEGQIAPMATPPQPASGQPAVNVDLRGSVIREEADIGRLQQAMGLEYSLRGNV